MNFTKPGLIILGVIAALSILLAIFTPWRFVDNYQLGYRFDARTGATTILPHSGYWAKTPVVEAIHVIDMRPRQVCITAGGAVSTANSRVLNCKLVQFDKKGLATFLAWHGRDDFEGPMLDELLKIYAYDGSGRGYPFLRVLRELKSNDAEMTTQVAQ